MAASALALLLNRLVALSQEELKLLRGVWEEVRYIRDELERMRAFLNVAESLQETNQQNGVWVKQVRDVVYDTEDVLDEFRLLTQYERRQGSFRLFFKIFQPILNCKAQRRIASKMKEIKKRVKHISEGQRRYRLEEGSMSSSFTNSRPWNDCRGDAILVEEAELVGIDKHRKQLIKHLTEGEGGLRVVSVFGMGGLGKTTLVRKVYEDANVKTHFQNHAWITVSQSSTIEDLLRDISEQIFEENKGEITREGSSSNVTDVSLKMKIKEFLNQKRYVIVLDDIWSPDKWEGLKCAFPASRGSRILLTTRHADIALTTSTEFDGISYPLQPLSREESWILFCRRAFKADPCPPYLKELSEGILRRCEGLPLSIVAIGGLLSTKGRRINEWEMVHRSLGAHIEGDSKLESMKRILSLSYYDLPGHLKACFLYFSIFPEGHLIKRMRLVRLWMAEGFVEDRQGQTPEEVGESYLNELVNRSLVQISKTTRNGRASNCRVHDHLREIALSECREQNFVAIANENSTQWRRLSIHGTFGSMEERNIFSQLRSLFVFRHFTAADLPAKSPISTLLSGSPRLLKVLDLQGAHLEIFPSEILKCYLLRYISLRETRVKIIPRSIRKLQYLETLDLKHTDVTVLPEEIRYLPKLRHLVVYQYIKQSPLPFHATYGFKAPVGMGDLQSLQKLCFVEADRSTSTLSEIGKLTQLRKLGITKLRREDSLALCSSVEKLSKLHSLDLSSIDEDEILDINSVSVSSSPPFLQRLWLQGRMETLPAWISSMTSLVKLRLRWSHLRSDPLESLQALPNLVELQLRQAYDGEALHFKAGGFQELRNLSLHGLEHLRRVTVEEGAMPLLEDLVIVECMLLEKVPAGIEFLPKIKSLGFALMQDELIKKLQRKEGDDYSRIENIPEVRYTYKEDNQWKNMSL